MARSVWGIVLVTIFILVVEMMERLSYYTFQGSQRNFLSQWYDSAQSIAINSSWGTLCYAVAILGGWVADAKLGRYKTILVFLVLYCIGVAMAAISAWPSINSQALYLVGMFAFVAFGTGGIKPNVANFGADQYDPSDKTEAAFQQKFFSFFYMMINVGAAVSYGYLVTLATSGQPPAIPQQYGYFWAFLIAAICMFVAMIIYVAGTPLYKRNPPDGDSLAGGTYYVVNAAKMNFRGIIALSGWVAVILFIAFSFVSAFVPESMVAGFAYTSLGLAVFSTATLSSAHLNQGFMAEIPDHPKDLLKRHEAMDFFDVVPTILVTNICFEIVYNMMNGPLVVQACQMNLKVGQGQLNGAFINIGDCFAIVIFTPILELLLFPAIRILRKSPVTRNEKLVAGFVVAGLSMVSAIILEYMRKAAPVLDTSDPSNISNCAGNPETNPIPMSDISAFWMFIPFALIGIAEVLINPMMYYFSYDQVPLRARSLAQAFNLLAQGSISQGYTTVVTLLFAPFLGDNDNLNSGSVQNFYWLGLAFAIAGIPLVLVVSSFYKEKDFKEAADSGPALDDEKPKKVSSLEPSDDPNGGSLEPVATAEQTLIEKSD